MRIEVMRILLKGDSDDEIMQKVYAKDVEKKPWRIYTDYVVAHGEYQHNKKFTHIYYSTGDEIIIDMTLEKFDELLDAVEKAEAEVIKEQEKQDN